jgi:hypothetical protein
MTTMRQLISLIEREDLAVNRIRQNARTLQGEIKYLNIDPGMKDRLTASIQVVTDYLDQII